MRVGIRYAAERVVSIHLPGDVLVSAILRPFQSLHSAKRQKKQRSQTEDDVKSSKTSRKRVGRPCRRKRENFREFVDELKHKVLDEGPDFKLDNVKLPPSIAKRQHTLKKITIILDTFKKDLHRANDLEQSVTPDLHHI